MDEVAGHSVVLEGLFVLGAEVEGVPGLLSLALLCDLENTYQAQ